MTAQGAARLAAEGSPEQARPVIEARGAGMEFPCPVVALDDATFRIRQGELVSFIGPSGVWQAEPSLA